MSLKGLFITGTDTEVGKTWVGSQLVATLYQRGIAVSPRKPIESGCEVQGELLIPADGTKYYEAVEKSISLDTICPLRLKTAISPARAALLEKRDISLADAAKCCQPAEGTLPVAEGAGGFYSPLTVDALNADLAQALGHPVLVVARDKLGCLNHIQLTVEAIQNRGLSIAGVVLNAFEGDAIDGMDNFAELSSLANYPVITTHSDNWIDQLIEALSI